LELNVARATRWLILTLAALASAGGRLQAGDAELDDFEPPVAGRPESFSGFIGAYHIAVRVAPAEVAVEDPVVLTVSVTGTGPANRLPQRPLLRLLAPALDKDFHVQDLPEKDHHDKSSQTWDFVYQLRPRRLDVTRVPALKLWYYDPAYRRYQPSYATAIKLTVKPRPQVQPPSDTKGAAEPAEPVWELVVGPSVLRRVGSGWPGWPLLLLLALGPPAACLAWYALWCRLHPEAAWRRRQRQSQAARQALAALHALGASAGAGAGLVLAQYLRQRLDLRAAEPTPQETARYLRRAGLSGPLAGKVADFFRACDASRFAPPPPPAAGGLAGEAVTLIFALESESCSPSPF
jgi:hypothetical protein